MKNTIHIHRKILMKYLKKLDDERYVFNDRIKNEIIYRRFNLMEHTFPFKKKFHVVFCRNVMIVKIKVAATAKILHMKPGASTQKITGSSSIDDNRIIAIGASTGGTEAINNVLEQLPPSVPGIVVVQHIPPKFSRMFAERLNDTIALEVREASTGDYLQKGHVLVAPGDQHMRIKRIGDKYKLECFKGEKVNGHCPSVDVLFESVAKEAGSRAIGIILTGMGYDGAKGLLSMRKKGARTIGQDEESSVVYGMPKVAYNIGAVEKQAALHQIPRIIYSMLNQ